MAGATVTSRALALLDAYAPDRRTQTLTQLAARAGLPLSTAHRLVGELVAWGGLERQPDGTYGIGIRVWEIGALAARGADLREVALPYLQDLYEATRENVQLAVLDGTDAVYLERISGPAAVHVVTRPGSRLPLHATAVGQVLLASAPDDVRDRVLAGPLRRWTERTLTDPGHVRRALADVRRSGVAVCRGQIELVSQSVAAPIRDGDARVVAAVSVVIPVERRVQPYEMAVRLAAQGITRSLAGQPHRRRAPRRAPAGPGAARC